MRVLRIELEAPVCSFRYPHFLVGRQLTFDMPPPSTIYGHIASAVGDWPDPAAIHFAYWFAADGKGDDLENQYVVTPQGVHGTAQPTHREFLLGVRMLLYVNRLDLADAFHNPKFPVILGRSQDLACYGAIQEVALERADRGYFEGTILPFDFRKRTARGVTVLMPRYVGPPPWREATFDRFVQLRDRVYCRPPGEEGRFGTREMVRFDGEDLELWVDPASPEWDGAHRALAFHTFVT